MVDPVTYYQSYSTLKTFLECLGKGMTITNNHIQEEFTA